MELLGVQLRALGTHFHQSQQHRATGLIRSMSVLIEAYPTGATLWSLDHWQR